jgi:DAACS family dicarboxylate/amino acid:cation (Na+ or H+) symporter
MGRTAINVFGNTVAVKLVERFAGDMAADEAQPAAAGLQMQDA